MKKILFSLLCATSVSAFADIGDSELTEKKFVTYTFETAKKEVTVVYKQPTSMIDPSKDAGYISKIILCDKSCKSFNYDATALPVTTRSLIAAPFAGNVNTKLAINGTIYSSISKHKPDYDLDVWISVSNLPDFVNLNNTNYQLKLTGAKIEKINFNSTN